MKAIEQAIKIVGSQKALAVAIGGGVKQAHVWNWINRDKNGVPAEYAFKIADAVDWKVTPHQLCPDVFPANLKKPE